MTVFNAAFSILPGKLELAKAFGRDAMGERRAELDEFQNRRGVVRENVVDPGGAPRRRVLSRVVGSPEPG